MRVEASPRDKARAIWDAAVAAVQPRELMRRAWLDPSLSLAESLDSAPKIVVFGAGKAGAAMAEALEQSLADQLARTVGIVNVPAETVRPLQKIELHAARPAGANQPTADGIKGAERILQLASSAGPDDVGICLLSGGGSALLPAPVVGVSLEDKQHVTRLLHACGATIDEMNAVRKHLSRIKGGRLAQAFAGKRLFSLIISDVIGDPLDVIASGPTSADPTTFADALAVLVRYGIMNAVPASIRAYLERGEAGLVDETPKITPANVVNQVIGNNALALAAAESEARRYGYQVLNLGSDIAGETAHVAKSMAKVVQKILSAGELVARPACVLSGGETTVTLGSDHGLGGRNQEFVLAVIESLSSAEMKTTVVLSGGTDGEDGPTDAAGAVADSMTMDAASRHGLDPAAFLARHDAYHFFEKTGGLIKTGLTQTNVMDIRVILVN